MGLYMYVQIYVYVCMYTYIYLLFAWRPGGSNSLFSVMTYFLPRGYNIVLPDKELHLSLWVYTLGPKVMVLFTYLEV